MMFLVLDLYCLIPSPLLIIVLAASGGANYIVSLKNMRIGLCSVPILLIAYATGLVFLVLDLYCLITLHLLIIVLAASGGAD